MFYLFPSFTVWLACGLSSSCSGQSCFIWPSQVSFTGYLSSVPATVFWPWEAWLEGHNSQATVHSVQSLKAFVLTLGDILRKLLTHHKAYFLFFFLIFWPNKVLIIFKTSYLHLVAYVVAGIIGSTEQKSSFSVLVFSLVLTTNVWYISLLYLYYLFSPPEYKHHMGREFCLLCPLCIFRSYNSVWYPIYTQ